MPRGFEIPELRWHLFMLQLTGIWKMFCLFCRGQCVRFPGWNGCLNILSSLTWCIYSLINSYLDDCIIVRMLDFYSFSLKSLLPDCFLFYVHLTGACRSLLSWWQSPTIIFLVMPSSCIIYLDTLMTIEECEFLTWKTYMGSIRRY